ncbi:MAG TPA: translesion error-prone DNA polymerase V autoproteolytic subunit [Paenalcaligenes hominis]|mgnify:CR=1 FL=1|uniref:DNA polymerase V n=1 Tax=Paenalcaligenes hominis TaxID=643674 RepID=A0A9D2VEN0_9BURK|nr:translesion error-prone DNA polymerase V autoproteolytic subunit [Paenalcaligenes hominis]NJB64082.1 DNA polymerase V [Paenalcaligenes hominis]GGE62948.1 DNA polymerase V subunit UmuD [Paenalcaligenes hominis]HJH23130.1 translesion error-prone DNA polymerase V autoproteolytic subunit [Paenalcaligenes hominis]
MTPQPFDASTRSLWFVSATVQGGFPSPAEDFYQPRVDLNTLLIRQPEATFFMRIRGTSMRDMGIDDGDYVIIDRSLTPKHGNLVVAIIDNEFTLKQLYQKHNRLQLLSANPDFAPIELKDQQQLHIWGVVTWTFKKHHHVLP